MAPAKGERKPKAPGGHQTASDRQKSPDDPTVGVATRDKTQQLVAMQRARNNMLRNNMLVVVECCLREVTSS